MEREFLDSALAGLGLEEFAPVTHRPATAITRPMFYEHECKSPVAHPILPPNIKQRTKCTIVKLSIVNEIILRYNCVEKKC